MGEDEDTADSGGFSLFDRATGFLGGLADSVVRVEEAKAARNRARQDTGGGYTVAPSGDLVKNSTQQTAAPPAPVIPQGMWIIGGAGLALMVLVLVLRR